VSNQKIQSSKTTNNDRKKVDEEASVWTIFNIPHFLRDEALIPDLESIFIEIGNIFAPKIWDLNKETFEEIIKGSTLIKRLLLLHNEMSKHQNQTNQATNDTEVYDSVTTGVRNAIQQAKTIVDGLIHAMYATLIKHYGYQGLFDSQFTTGICFHAFQNSKDTDFFIFPKDFSDKLFPFIKGVSIGGKKKN